MAFTAGDVYRSTLRLAPELRARPASPDVVASTFNDALLDLVLDVIDADAERLAARHELPAWAVASDPVDLTAAGTEEAPETREWLHIAFLDWKSGGQVGGEVWLTTLEARHRGAHDYPGAVVGYLDDQLRRLHKVAGWQGVDGLVLYGVRAPVKVREETLDKVEHDYPRALESAIRWDLLVQLATHHGIGDGRIQYWEGKRIEARERLVADARGHAASRIEDIPISYGW